MKMRVFVTCLFRTRFRDYVEKHKSILFYLKVKYDVSLRYRFQAAQYTCYIT
jgi:hypothetical protein